MAETLDCPALLGADLGEDVTIALMQHIICESTRKKSVPLGASPSLAQTSEPVGSGQDKAVEVVPVRGTRAGLARELAEIEADDVASAQSECRPVDLLQVINLPESYFGTHPSSGGSLTLYRW